MGVIAKRVAQRQAARNGGDVQIPPVNIQYAHNGEHVVLLFDKATSALAFTAGGVTAHIKAIQDVLDRLVEHRG